MEFQLVGVERQPIGVVVPAGGVAPRRFRPILEPRLEPLLGVFDPRAALGRGIAARHQRLGLEIELAQELRLPAVPHARARPRGCRRPSGSAAAAAVPASAPPSTKFCTVLGSDTSRFCAASLIVRCWRTSQDDGRRIGRRQAEPRTDRLGQRRAEIGMIAGQALGHVVQQHRHEQHLARFHALDEVARPAAARSSARRARCARRCRPRTSRCSSTV